MLAIYIILCLLAPDPLILFVQASKEGFLLHVSKAQSRGNRLERWPHSHWRTLDEWPVWMQWLWGLLRRMHTGVTPVVALSPPSLVAGGVSSVLTVATKKDAVVVSWWFRDRRRSSILTKKVRNQGLLDECGFLFGSDPHRCSFVFREVKPEVFHDVNRFDVFRKRHAVGTFSAAVVAVSLFEAAGAFGSGISIRGAIADVCVCGSRCACSMKSTFSIHSR